MSILTLETIINGEIKNVRAIIDDVKVDLTAIFNIEKSETEIYEHMKARCIGIGYTIE